MMRLNLTVPFSCNNKYSEDASTLLLSGDSISSSLSHAKGTEPILLQLERSIIKPLFSSAYTKNLYVIMMPGHMNGFFLIFIHLIVNINIAFVRIEKEFSVY